MQTNPNNIYKSFNMNASLGSSDLLILCLATILSGAYIPLALFSNLDIYKLSVAAYLAAGAFLAAVIKTTGNFRQCLYMLLGTVLLFVTVQINVTALVLSLVATVAIPAFLVYKTKNYLFLLPFAACAAAVFGVTGELFPAAFALFPVFPALVLLFCIKRERNKSVTLAALTAGYAAPVIFALLILLLLEYKTVNAEIIKANVEAAREAITGQIEGALTRMYLGDQMLLTKDDISDLSGEYVAYVFNYLPAIGIIISMALAYFSHSTVFKSPRQREKIRKSLRK